MLIKLNNLSRSTDLISALEYGLNKVKNKKLYGIASVLVVM